MKISYNWLKKYVNTSLAPKEVAKLLTDCGLEVEHIEPYESIKGGFNGLVIGEVKTCIKHPNADKLSLTTVDVGSEKILNIVCGAPNVAAGQKVVVALEGATLYPSQGEPFTIKKSKIRGEVSEGMLCAEDEIGLGTSHAGIMVLPPDTKTGLPASEYFKVYFDSVFEIGITPNRADALSHIGVARDLVAAINLHYAGTEKLKLAIPELTPLRSTKPSGDEITVTIENPEACKRYTSAEIRGTEVKESPQWLKNYLSAIGLRPINTIVDITNFVMYETGQPLHAFDADKIKGKKVIVRKAKLGERITTLDGTSRQLRPFDLLICNDTEAMCIAGVYGGKESGVTASTRNIFLESACFDAAHIRRTAKSQGLHTDASFRYERGADVNITTYALTRAFNLMQEVNAAASVTTITDVYPSREEDRKLEFSPSYANKLAGHSMAAEKVAGIIEATGIKIVEKEEDKWMLSIPGYRMDITCQADIVEEILRFYGYNNIPVPPRLNIPLVYTGENKSGEMVDKISSFLASSGFSEVMNTSLSSSRFGEDKYTVKIANPLSNDLDVMRGTLLFNGLTNIALNQNNKQTNLKLFEFGRSYHKANDGKYMELEHLSLWVCGNKSPLSWNSKEMPADFYYLKSNVAALIERMTGVSNPVEMFLLNSGLLFSGLTFSIESKEVAVIGRVHKELRDRQGIKDEVFFADINWKELVQNSARGIEIKEINRFPSVTRDLALIIDKTVNFEMLNGIAFKTEKELLKQVSVFDVYEGKGVEDGKKSYALRFILQSDRKTLSDKEIDKAMERLVSAFTQQAGAVIRNS